MVSGVGGGGLFSILIVFYSFVINESGTSTTSRGLGNISYLVLFITDIHAIKKVIFTLRIYAQYSILLQGKKLDIWDNSLYITIWVPLSFNQVFPKFSLFNTYANFQVY